MEAHARLSEVDFKWHEPLSRHTTFKIGGAVKCLAIPRTEEGFEDLLLRVRTDGIPHMILGGGSNVLAPDGSWNAMVIKPARAFSLIRRLEPGEDGKENTFVGAGVALAALLRFCLAEGLRGLEWSVGIPGSIGGAVVMNAGAKGACMADVIQWIDVMDGNGNRRRVPRCELTPVYRSMELPRDWIVLGACFKLEKGKREAIRRLSSQYMRQRRQATPLGRPSAGCVFKNPPGASAGALIDECGLKGLRIGDAAISEKHANWIINHGRASSRDVVALMEIMESEVFHRFGVSLEREVRVIGR